MPHEHQHEDATNQRLAGRLNWKETQLARAKRGRVCAQHATGENAPFRTGDNQRQLAHPVMHLGDVFK